MSVLKPAEIVVTGFVPSLNGITALTRGLIQQAIVKSIRYLHFHGRLAYRIGGHQAHGGASWKPLAPATIAKKLRAGMLRPSAPLVETGRMSNNVRVRVRIHATETGWHYLIEEHVSAWSKGKPYPEYHAKYTWNTRAGKFNPVRLPVDITEQDIAHVRSVIQFYMRQGGPPPPGIGRRGRR